MKARREFQTRMTAAARRSLFIRADSHPFALRSSAPRWDFAAHVPRLDSPSRLA